MIKKCVVLRSGVEAKAITASGYFLNSRAHTRTHTNAHSHTDTHRSCRTREEMRVELSHAQKDVMEREWSGR